MSWKVSFATFAVALMCVGVTSAFQMYVDAGSALEVVAPCEVIDEATAFFGKIMQAPEGAGDHGNGYAKYSFAVPSDGNYRLWGRVTSLSDLNDSFYWAIDFPGTPTSSENCSEATPGDEVHIWDAGQFADWGWSDVQSRNCQGWVDGAIVALSAGRHIIHVIQREDGTQLDGLVISDDTVTIADLPADEAAAMEIATAVEPGGKTATVWGALKARH